MVPPSAGAKMYGFCVVGPDIPIRPSATKNGNIGVGGPATPNQIFPPGDLVYRLHVFNNTKIVNYVYCNPPQLLSSLSRGQLFESCFLVVKENYQRTRRLKSPKTGQLVLQNNPQYP